MKPEPVADPIETQEAVPSDTVAVIFGVVAKGVVNVTTRLKALSSDVPEPYWMNGVFFTMVPV